MECQGTKVGMQGGQSGPSGLGNLDALGLLRVPPMAHTAALELQEALDHPVGVPCLTFLPPVPRLPTPTGLTTKGVFAVVAQGTLGARSPLLVGPLALHVPPAGGEENVGGRVRPTLTLSLIHTPCLEVLPGSYSA